jgi:hypothetical protein
MERKREKAKAYTTEEIRQILDLKKAGAYNREIAAVVGRSECSIATFLTAERTTKRYSKRLNKASEKEKATTNMVDIKVNGVKVAEAPSSIVETHTETPAPVAVKTMTPREMIKALYNLGYRIENNQLVCYVKQTVKIQDIING